MSRGWFALFMVLALPAQAEGYMPISDEAEFRSLVSGRELRYGMFGISLVIAADGRINGEAMGVEVTGTWAWREGYFCREMDWSGMAIPYNCQLVEVQDAVTMRFTTDMGTGRSAAFDLQ